MMGEVAVADDDMWWLEGRIGAGEGLVHAPRVSLTHGRVHPPFRRSEDGWASGWTGRWGVRRDGVANSRRAGHMPLRVLFLCSLCARAS